MTDRPDLQALFHDRYPRLFVLREPLYCGPGWYPLLHDLSADLEAMIEHGIEQRAWSAPEPDPDAIGDPRHEHPWPHILQLKEKFGGLRVYMDQGTPAMRQAIDRAALRAALTCDQCGEPGRLRRLGGYLCTRCDQHARREDLP